MLKQIWIAECDLCGKRVPARRTSGRNNEPEFVLPAGWTRGASNYSFTVCPECAEVVSTKKLKVIDDDKQYTERSTPNND